MLQWIKDHKLIVTGAVLLFFALVLWLLFRKKTPKWQPTGTVLNGLPAWSDTFDWGPFAAAVKVDCGGNGSEDDSTTVGQCWKGRSGKILAFLKGMNVKPSADAFTKLKAEIKAYEADSSAIGDPSQITVGQFL